MTKRGNEVVREQQREQLDAKGKIGGKKIGARRLSPNFFQSKALIPANPRFQENNSLFRKKLFKFNEMQISSPVLYSLARPTSNSFALEGD